MSDEVFLHHALFLKHHIATLCLELVAYCFNHQIYRVLQFLFLDVLLMYLYIMFDVVLSNLSRSGREIGF